METLVKTKGELPLMNLEVFNSNVKDNQALMPKEALSIGLLAQMIAEFRQLREENRQLREENLALRKKLERPVIPVNHVPQFPVTHQVEYPGIRNRKMKSLFPVD